MSTALYIGRFQPFHNGHLQAVKDILQHHSKIIIALGSSQESNTAENPWSYDERKAMINAVMKKEGIKNNREYTILAVPDINHHAQWVEHVCRCVGKFDVMYTGSALTKKLFSEKGFVIADLPRHGEISASEIRKRIIEGMNRKEFVPKEVVPFVEKKTALIKKLSIKAE